MGLDIDKVQVFEVLWAEDVYCKVRDITLNKLDVRGVFTLNYSAIYT